MSEQTRYTVAVDFDGVLHEYRQPWIAHHVIPDGPTEGAIEWLWRTLQKFDVVIFSTRGKTWRGRRAVNRWLKQYGGGLYHETMGNRGLEDIRCTDRKPAALIYLDDRAVRFAGTFPTPHEIHAARPWNKPRPTTTSGLDVEASRRICEAATKGPWRDDEGYRVWARSHIGVVCIAEMKNLSEYPVAPSPADCTFIAHVRTAHPQALDEITALRSRMAEQEKVLEKIAEGAGPYNRDPLIHAENVIEEAKAIARAALTEYRTPKEGVK